MTRLTIEQTEALIKYFTSKIQYGDCLDATDMREIIENIINN